MLTRITTGLILYIWSKFCALLSIRLSICFPRGARVQKKAEKDWDEMRLIQEGIWRTATSVLPRLIAFVAIRCYLSSQIICI